MTVERTSTGTSEDHFDAIVIGAGHNGLVAAAYLARAGLEVLVLEARHSIGGCSSTEAFGGCRVNICNCDHITFRTTPIIEELGLHDFGLTYIDVDPAQINIPWSGGPAWPLFHSVERTLEGLAKTYPSQVEGYRRYSHDAIPVARLVLEAAANGPRHLDLMRTVASSRVGGVKNLLRWSRMSAATVMRHYFTDDNVMAPALATGPIVWGLSPEMPGTGLGALAYALRHVAQLGRPVGGSGRLAEALGAYISSVGGVIRTASQVESVLVERDRVAGVVLASQEMLTSDIVVSAVDPRRTFVEWITNPPHGAASTIERWRHAPREEGYESKIDAVIEGLPVYRQIAPGLCSELGFSTHGSSHMITPSLAEMHEAYLAKQDGRISEHPVMFVNVPTVHDPSMRDAAEANQHVFSLETLFTPYSLHGGWESSREPNRWLELHESLLVKGSLSKIVDWRVMTPDKYESEFHLPSGHATSFAGGPLSALKGRPQELTRYRTPVDGLYLCGAATFPGAGIWGASGRHCAREILGSV